MENLDGRQNVKSVPGKLGGPKCGGIKDIGDVVLQKSLDLKHKGTDVTKKK